MGAEVELVVGADEKAGLEGAEGARDGGGIPLCVDSVGSAKDCGEI